jgi:serine protease Do
VVVADDTDGVVQARHDPDRQRSEVHPARGEQRGWLGIVMYSSSDDGTIVKEMAEDGPAAKAGLKKGDRIRSFDRVTIEDYWDITNVLRKKEPGDRVSLDIVRDGDEMTLDVTLGERPRRSHEVWYSSGGEDVKVLSPGKGTVIRLGGNRLFLGVDVKEMSEDLRGFFKAPDDAGVLINRVIEGTPAERAGLRAGDVVIEVDGKEIRSVGDISRALRSREAGDEVPVVVIRDRNRKTLDVTLDERESISSLRDLDLMTPGVYAIPSLEGLERLEGLESLKALGSLEHLRLTDEKREEVRRSMEEVRRQIEELREQMRSMRRELNERRGEQDPIHRQYEEYLDEAQPAGYDI